MKQENKPHAGKLVIALETHTSDGWYGQNRRYYYAGPDGQGFKTRKEARKFKSSLRKWVKETVLRVSSRTEINGDIEIGLLENFCTYRYCGPGPSYSCPNMEVKNLINNTQHENH